MRLLFRCVPVYKRTIGLGIGRRLNYIMCNKYLGTLNKPYYYVLRVNVNRSHKLSSLFMPFMEV